MYTTFAVVHFTTPLSFMAAHTLLKIPKDVLDFILSEQRRIKEKKGVRVYSIDLTVYHLLRELKACRKGEEIAIE